MAKVLMVNPVVREEDKPKHIPYGMAILAQIAIDHGHLVQIYDANAWRKGDEILRQVFAADDWDVIAIGGLTTTYAYVRKALKLAEDVAPNAFKILGGGILTSMPLDIMEWLPEVDLGVIGEAFVTWPVVLKMLDEGQRDFSQTEGVAYRDAEGKAHLTAARPTIVDLDCLPFPAWDLFPLDIYFANSQDLFSEEIFTSKKRMDINGSLGCNLVCRYCWHLGTTGDMVVKKNPKGENDVVFSYGRTIRYHSARYIVDMVKTLVDKYQVDFASFIDENLMTMHAFSNRTWLHELCDLWIKEGLQPTCRRDGVPHDDNCRGVHWCGTSHAGLARPETLKHMYEAGCSHLVYGIESFDPEILKRLGKGVTARRNFEAIRECLESGIRPIPNIIIGFPEESFQSIRNTMDGMKKLGIHAKPHFATPYPGSEWYYAYKDSILRQYDGDLEKFILALGDATSITAVISHEFTAMDLMGLQQIVATRDVRLLEQAEKHRAPLKEPVATPQVSFNFEATKLKAPVESAPRERIRVAA